MHEILSECMCIINHLQKPEEGIRSGISDSCELSCGGRMPACSGMPSPSLGAVTVSGAACSQDPREPLHPCRDVYWLGIMV